MSSDIQIVVSQEQGSVPITVFHIKGAIGADNYEQLQTRTSEVFEGGTRNLILDLSEVTYMSSAAFRALHHIFNLMHPGTADETMSKAAESWWQGDAAKSPHLKLVSPPSDVLKVIKAVGFDAFLEIYNNREEAVASF